jgi:DNA gyrase/topoisomerase IV subunit B
MLAIDWHNLDRERALVGYSNCRALTEKINKKNKHANVKPFMVKNHLWVFLNCNIENPAFDSQVPKHHLMHVLYNV